MSCFMVNDKTIDSILTGMKRVAEHNDYNLLMNYKGISDDAWNTLGRTMLALNDYALACRYTSHNIGDCSHNHYKFDFLGGLHKAEQSVACLKCWMYQCSEGNADEKAVFKEMKKVLGEMCQAIVYKSDDYKNADWWMRDG